MLNGGWDYASLVVFLGETNVGKCLCSGSELKIRNKHNEKVEKIKIEEFFNRNK